MEELTMLCSVCESNKANQFTGALLKSDDVICYSCIKKLGISALNYSYKKIFRNYTAEDLKKLIQHNAKLNYKNELSKLSFRKKEQKSNYLNTKQVFLDHKSRISGKMHADFVDKKVLFEKSLTTPSLIINFDDVISYTPTVYGHSVSKHHRGARGITGGLIAGPIGAIVGASTGGKDYDAINDVHITINFKDGSSRVLKYVTTEYKSDSLILKSLIKDYHDGISILDAIIAENSQAVINVADAHNSQPINTDELSKLKSLLDDGIITQEEFEAKKKQILGI
ncbi:SHOCT domain-containing protein [Lactiplantibacillus plantarum]|uniref:SHOCT domain-containing protein n=2 Tax=Lactiplantibacillus plantarum TaxID=1590 RepID=UPI0020A2EBE2|nr:SHOCT domain-containing protein [Lactiplantibacillus plantarum]